MKYFGDISKGSGTRSSAKKTLVSQVARGITHSISHNRLLKFEFVRKSQKSYLFTHHAFHREKKDDFAAIFRSVIKTSYFLEIPSGLKTEIF